MNFGHMWSSAITQELGTADSTKLFTDARRQQAIDNGVLAFADLTECSKRQSTITTSNAVREYDLLSTVNVPGGDFLRLTKQSPEFQFTDSNGNVSYVTGADFPLRDLNWLNQYQPGWRQSTGGTPTAYYLREDGGSLYFGFDTPPTIGSSESAKVLLPYLARPSTMSASTAIPFTVGTQVRTDLEPYHQAPVHYAAYELEKLRVNEEASKTQWQLFLNFVERYLRSMRPRGGQTIRQARSYFSESKRRRGDVGGTLADPWA